MQSVKTSFLARNSNYVLDWGFAKKIRNEKFVKICLDSPINLTNFFESSFQNSTLAILRFSCTMFLSKTCWDTWYINFAYRKKYCIGFWREFSNLTFFNFVSHMYLISSSKEILETKIDWKDERKIWEIDLLSSGFGTCGRSFLIKGSFVSGVQWS